MMSAVMTLAELQTTADEASPTMTTTMTIVWAPTASITSGENPAMHAVLRLDTTNIVYGWAAIVV
jgi:hypothetical protein